MMEKGCFSSNLSRFNDYWYDNAKSLLVNDGFYGQAMKIAGMYYPLFVADFFNGTLAAHVPLGNMGPANESPHFYLTHVHTYFTVFREMRRSFERRKATESSNSISEMFVKDFNAMQKIEGISDILGAGVTLDSTKISVQNLCPYLTGEVVGSPQGLRQIIRCLFDDDMSESTFSNLELDVKYVEPSPTPRCREVTACEDAAKWVTRCLLRRCVGLASSFPGAEFEIQNLLVSICDGTLHTKVDELCVNSFFCPLSRLLTTGPVLWIVRHFLRYRCADRNCDDLTHSIFPLLDWFGFDQVCRVGRVAI
jgi:hypothetical protein